MLRITHRKNARRNLMISLWLLCAVTLSAPVSRAQSWSWTTETVDISGRYTSLALDADGNLHMSYLNEYEGIKYAFRPAGSLKWYKMIIDAWEAEQNLTTRIALDANGNPHVCYTPRVLKYAAFEKGAWKIQEIAPGSGLIAYSCSLALALDGSPHVIWYQVATPNAEYYHLKYATLKNGIWIARTIDFDNETGKWNSLVLDSRGNPHLSYSAATKGALKYAEWNGENWVIRTVDSRTGARNNEEYRGMGNSLMLSNSQSPRISYYSEGALKFAQLHGDKWQIQTVDLSFSSLSWQGYRSTLVADSQGHPHICYETGGILKHAYWDGSEWNLQVIAPAGVEAYRHSAMVINKDNIIYISYRDPSDGSLKVAVGRPDNVRSTTASKDAK